MALRYANQSVSIEGKKAKQVNIKMAEKAYNEGKQLWLLPCNIRINNAWQHPMPLDRKSIEDNAFKCGSTFSQIVNEFKYYNCDNERGKYPIFFVEVG